MTQPQPQPSVQVVRDEPALVGAVRHQLETGDRGIVSAVVYLWIDGAWRRGAVLPLCWRDDAPNFLLDYRETSVLAFARNEPVDLPPLPS